MSENAGYEVGSIYARVGLDMAGVRPGLQQVGRELHSTQRQMETFSGSASKAERELGRTTRGALAGSGVFSSLGRSLAFASGGFLAVASVFGVLRRSVDVAREAAVTQRQLATQFRASHRDLSLYRGEIDKTTLRLSALSGFTKDELDRTFTILFRSTGKVAESLRLTSLAANVARGRNMDLAAASILVGKVAGGNVSILRRYGLEIGKHATATQGLALLTAKYAGQARAGATEQMRFNAILHDSEVIVGQGILPTLNKYLAEGARWLQQMNESGKLQRDVASAAKQVRSAVSDGVTVFKIAKDVIGQVDRVTGSFTHTLEALLAIKVATVLGEWVSGFRLLAGAETAATAAAVTWEAVGGGALLAVKSDVAAVGIASTGAASEVGLLGSKLSLLKMIGPIVIGIEILTHTRQVGNVIGDAVKKATGSSTLGKIASTYERNALGLLTGQTVAGILHSIISGSGSQSAAGGIDTGGQVLPFPGGSAVGRLIKGQHKGSVFGVPSSDPRTVSLMGQFNLLELKLADTAASNVGQQKSILSSEYSILKRLEGQAKTLKDRTSLAQQAQSVEGQIASLDASALANAKKRKKAAEKTGLGGVPLSLQLAQAKADALAAGLGSSTLTSEQISAAKAIRTAEMKAIHSHRLSMQGLINAWNEVSTINQELQGVGKGMTGTYHAVSSAALTAGLGLSHTARVEAEDRIAQALAHRGYVPSGPAAQGHVVHIGTVVLPGVRNPAAFYTEMERQARLRGRQGNRG